MLDDFLDPNVTDETKEEIIGLVSPHAGYVYSGWVTGKAYRRLIGKKYDAIIIIGPSHRAAFDGSSVFPGEGYSTPLGVAKVDVKLAKEIGSFGKGVELSMNGHSWKEEGSAEHSIEVQIPFLQVVQSGTPIVPICMGSQNNSSADNLMKAIVAAVNKTGKNVLIVASSDLSHYHSQKEARELDMSLIQAVNRYDYFKLAYQCFTRKWEACGAAPIVVAMMAAEQLGATSVSPETYASSADSPYIKMDSKKVVGYYSCIMVKNSDVSFGNLPGLNDEDKAALLASARKGIEKGTGSDTSTGKKFVPKTLGNQFAAFVTLKKAGRLRGCMGHTFASQPLMAEVEECGRMAASQDPRFPAVKTSELKDIDLEITILSRYKRIFNTEEVIPGVHGVYLRLGYSSGVFLPQVATENNWNRTEFLENLGLKAGLDRSAYLNPDAELYIFNAKVIH